MNGSIGNDSCRGRRLRVSVVAAALVGLVQPALADSLTGHGKALVELNCVRCHAIGKTGKSSHPDAPAFRTLSKRYRILRRHSLKAFQPVTRICLSGLPALTRSTQSSLISAACGNRDRGPDAAGRRPRLPAPLRDRPIAVPEHLPTEPGQHPIEQTGRLEW